MKTKIVKYIFIILVKIILFTNFTFAYGQTENFESWLISFKKRALNQGVSQETINISFKNVKFLEQVIKYDRKQPEFIEDTITYVSKRASISRATTAKKLYIKNKKLFSDVELEFGVEKEILLSLWGIETNFGKYVGKMDIISSLATLSFDKRRSEFFSKQLLILLKLIDKKLINPINYQGSWAGAYGNFQFMPSTINSYAIDYDNNNKIELKNSLDDALASAANYIKKIGWKKDQPCFYRVKLTKKIDEKYINYSARKIKSKYKVSKWKKRGVVKFDGTEFESNNVGALILPDGKPNSPMYLVFGNYEKILKWNRSLRFGISVCTLANMIKI